MSIKDALNNVIRFPKNYNHKLYNDVFTKISLYPNVYKEKQEYKIYLKHSHFGNAVCVSQINFPYQKLPIFSLCIDLGVDKESAIAILQQIARKNKVDLTPNYMMSIAAFKYIKRNKISTPWLIGK